MFWEARPSSHWTCGNFWHMSWKCGFIHPYFQDPLHSGAAKSTPHTAPHLRMPQLETYEPTHKDSNPIATEETTDSQSPPAAEPADGPSGACGGNPDNPDPSVPSSDDVLADDNNRVTDSPVDGGNAFVMFHFTSLLSLVFFLQR